VFKKLQIFFEHNRAERNGTIAFLIIVLIALIGTILFAEFYTPQQKNTSEIAAYIETHKKQNSPNLDIATLKPFEFDPNTLSDSGYAQLGLTDKEIRTLRNYQKAGAEFEVKLDFKKLFFIDSAEYNLLEPFIQLPDSVMPKSDRRESNKSTKIKWSDTTSYKPFEENLNVELNSADTNALKALNGIGSYYAREIVKYRTDLGGYYDIGQLLELWKMDPSKIDLFADRVTVDRNLIKTIPINQLTAQELARHPYISLHLASKIIYAREAEGNFSDMTDMENRKLVNAELSSKLAPYLDFE